MVPPWLGGSAVSRRCLPNRRSLSWLVLGLVLALAGPLQAQPFADLPAEPTATRQAVTVYQVQRPVLAWGRIGLAMDTHRIFAAGGELGLTLRTVPLLAGATGSVDFTGWRYEVRIGAVWRSWAEEEELVHVIAPSQAGGPPSHWLVQMTLPRLAQNGLYAGLERHSLSHDCHGADFCIPRPRDRFVLGYLYQRRRGVELQGPASPRLGQPERAIDVEVRLSYTPPQPFHDAPWEERIGFEATLTAGPVPAMRVTAGLGWEAAAVRAWLAVALGGEVAHAGTPKTRPPR